MSPTICWTVIKKPERSTPKDINLACRSKRHLYSLLMLVTAFWSGIPMAWASHHHARAASGFLCENHHADSVQKERETDDDFRSRDSVGRFAHWRVGQERGRFTSLSDCSLGGLGDDFPKRACSPATLTARSFPLSSEPLWNSYRNAMRIPPATSGEKAGATTPVSLECTIRGLLSWKQGGCNARYFMHDVCDCVLRREQLVGHRWRTLLTSQR